MTHASWLRPLFNVKELKEHANLISIQINKDKRKLEINSIAITGISGSIIGGLISCKTNLPLIVVRKDSDDRHSSHNVEFNKDLQKLNYAFVDDLISGGKTVKTVNEKINNENFDYTNRMIKIYLYNDNHKDRFYLNSKDEQDQNDNYIPVFSMRKK